MAAATDSKSSVPTADGNKLAVTDKPTTAGDFAYGFAIFSIPQPINGKQTVFSTIRRLIVADIIAALHRKEVGTFQTRFGYITKKYEPVQVRFMDEASRALQIERIDVYVLDAAKLGTNEKQRWNSLHATGVIGVGPIGTVVKSIVFECGHVQIFGK